MYEVTRLLPKDQFQELVKRLPTPKWKGTGRKRCNKEALITGMLQVLKLGIPWNKIFGCGASPSSCYRYFREVQRRGIFKKEFKKLADVKTDITECAIDTDSTRSFNFPFCTAWDGKHKQISTKISLFTDRFGLPVDVLFGDGKTHDKSFVWKHYENTKKRRKKILNLDKIYVSLELRREMRNKGTYVNMKTRKGDYIRKRGPKFGLKEEKYKVRFLIEKTFSWIENFKRCKYRVDRLVSSFKGFVYLALLIILIRS